jgi:fructokinase
MSKYIVGIGEVLWDYFVDEHIYKVGGAPLNFAYHAKLFGCDSLVI